MDGYFPKFIKMVSSRTRSLTGSKPSALAIVLGFFGYHIISYLYRILEQVGGFLFDIN